MDANKYRIITPLLAMPYIAALTPTDVEVKIIDEEHDLMTEYEEADLVGISGMTMHAHRMYKIADHYRTRGIPVVLGGIHVSFMPREASKHANTIVIGEAENIWPGLVADFRARQLKPVYQSVRPPDLAGLPFARLYLVDGPSYTPPHGSLNSIMASRGCPHNCNFCCISKMFGRRFRTRPISEVIDEINSMNKEPIFFADDNLIGDRKYAKNLFKALVPFRRKWGSQVSIKIAEEPELLKLAYASGCRYVFIGIESVHPQNIVFLNKQIVNEVKKYGEAIKRIKEHGIKIIGSFIVGLDYDDESCFEKVYEFVIQNQIDVPMVGILTPFPGTDLFKTLKKQNRIISQDWNRFNFNHVVFKPRRMTPEQLQFGYNNLVKKLSRYQASKARADFQKNVQAAYSF